LGSVKQGDARPRNSSLSWRKIAGAGPGCEADAARAWSILGDRDRALPILERLLVEPFAESLTPALLRLDPVWDPIRDDPRFQKLADDKKL
jgi:hypothetical protein